MATKNALFYSIKFNRSETIKSHRTENAAIKAAGDYGMIFNTAKSKEYQVHAMSNGTNRAFMEGSNGHEPMDFSMLTFLQSEQLL